MPKPYRVTFVVRLINRLGRFMTNRGLSPAHYYILTVKGRKTGTLHSTPVILVEEGNKRWLVSPYGDVQWVHNARAAGEVTLSRAGHAKNAKITEIYDMERAAILKKYNMLSKYSRPYFIARPDAPVESYLNECANHPVFALNE